MKRNKMIYWMIKKYTIKDQNLLISIRNYCMQCFNNYQTNKTLQRSLYSCSKTPISSYRRINKPEFVNKARKYSRNFLKLKTNVIKKHTEIFNNGNCTLRTATHERNFNKIKTINNWNNAQKKAIDKKDYIELGIIKQNPQKLLLGIKDYNILE